jgi:chromosome segregation ATPase
LNALTISHEELSMSLQKLSADHSRVLIAHGQETRSLQAAIYAKTEELAQHKSEKKALLQEKATILSQCDCLNKEVISLQSELAIAHAVRIELTEKLEEKCLEWEKLSDDLLSLSDSCKAKEIEAMDQVEEIRQLESCITQLKSDLKTLDDNLKVKSNEGLILEQQNSKWREQNASLEGDLSTLNLAADSLREELNSLLLNLAEKDALVSQLLDQKETLQIALSEREKVVQATRADLESTAHDRGALQDKLSDAQKSLDANSKRIEELNKELYSVRRTTTTQLQAAAVKLALHL